MKLFGGNIDFGLRGPQLSSLGGEVFLETSVLLLKVANATQKLKDSSLEDFESFFTVHKLQAENVAHGIKARLFICFPYRGFNSALSVTGSRT